MSPTHQGLIFQEPRSPSVVEKGSFRKFRFSSGSSLGDRKSDSAEHGPVKLKHIVTEEEVKDDAPDKVEAGGEALPPVDNSVDADASEETSPPTQDGDGGFRGCSCSTTGGARDSPGRDTTKGSAHVPFSVLWRYQLAICSELSRPSFDLYVV